MSASTNQKRSCCNRCSIQKTDQDITISCEHCPCHTTPPDTQATWEPLDPHNVKAGDKHARLSNAITHAQGAINAQEMQEIRIEIFDAVNELLSSERTKTVEMLEDAIRLHSKPFYFAKNEPKEIMCVTVRDIRTAITKLKDKNSGV